jgi:uncharacterized protein
MKLWQKVAVLSTLGFAVGFGAIYAFFGDEKSTADASSSGGKPVEVDWSRLRELDLASGRPSDFLKSVDGKSARVPGFMIPLEDNQESVSEFLLVPSPMACIHTPTPPANQIVHVKMAPGTKVKMSYGPVWAQGRLRIMEVTHAYGKASYEMVGERTEPYQ